MNDSVYNRQSSTLTINTPTKDEVFDFPKSYTDAERANSPELIMDQRNGTQEEQTSTASQVDDGLRTWGDDDSNSVKETKTIKQYLNKIEYDPSKTVHFLKEIDIFDDEIPTEAQGSSSDLTKQDLKSFAKEKDTVTENQVVDHSIILPDDSHSNKKVSTKSRKNTTKNQDCKSERLFREARRHNPPKKIFPFGSKLRGPTNCKTDALFDKARKLNKKLVVFNTKDYSKLTIENGQEFHECKKEGLKISEENTKLVNDALEKGQRVRRDGRNFIADDKKYIANRIINNKRVKGSRMSKSKK